MVFICRLCGKCENDSLGVAIFGEQGVKEALAYKIKLSLDVSVFEYDPLPKCICGCCLGKLVATFTFQENCRRVQIQLRERFLSSETWSLNATTSTTEVEQLPNKSIHGAAGETPIQESTLHILEDTSYSQMSGTAHNQNEICIEENHGNLTPSDLRNLQTQPSFVCAESAAGNIQTLENSRPQLEQPRAETQITLCEEPFNFRTFVRDEELVQAVCNKGSNKSNTRKTMKPPFVASATKKQNTGSGLELPAPVPKLPFSIQGSNMVSAHANMAVGQQAVNKPVSSGVGNHGISEVCNSHTNTFVGNSPERVQIVDSGSALNMFFPEEEDEVLVVEFVKANKDSIAQHWERCPSGFICKLCNKQFKRLNKCENHIRVHLGVKPYECQTCKRRYLKRRLLNEHYSFHLGKKLYQCKKCDKSFRYRRSFKSHAESHEEEFDSSYLCEICNKKFQSQFDYWSHKSSKHVIVESQMT